MKKRRLVTVAKCSGTPVSLLCDTTESLNIGLDYGRGPEDSVVYISVGTRWL